MRESRGDSRVTERISRGKRYQTQAAARTAHKADPVLQELLENVPLSDETIEVAVSLRQPSKALYLTPEETASVTENLIRKVCQEVGDEPTQLNVFKNIASFVVAAKPSFIRALLTHDEVERAMANWQPKLAAR